MSGNQQNYSMQVREVVVGLSAIAGFTVLSGQQGLGIQSIAGGTCFYGGTSLGLGGSFGIPVPTTLVNFDGYRGDVKFCALGATATIRVLSFFSNV